MTLASRRARPGVALATAIALGSVMWAPAFAQQEQPGATAELRNAGGTLVGTAALRDLPGGVAINGVFRNLSPGVHGFHIHEVGRCDVPGYVTAGGHFNPTGRQHGLSNPNGPHMGDLLNVIINDTGVGTINTRAAGATLTGENAILDADGAALIIDAFEDDQRSDPETGRPHIACGVIVAVSQTGLSPAPAPAPPAPAAPVPPGAQPGAPAQQQPGTPAQQPGTTAPPAGTPAQQQPGAAAPQTGTQAPAPGAPEQPAAQAQPGAQAPPGAGAQPGAGPAQVAGDSAQGSQSPSPGGRAPAGATLEPLPRSGALPGIELPLSGILGGISLIVLGARLRRREQLSYAPRGKYIRLAAGKKIRLVARPPRSIDQ